MRREQVEIEAPSIGGAGTVIGYGHYGRPVLLFPAEQGRAWDLEGVGMIDAVADLIEAGRVKLYCVDSYDGASWSNRSIPLEERARAHDAYEAWIVERVVPAIHADLAGPQEILVAGCSMGAYHAANFALRRADLFPAGAVHVGQLRPLALARLGRARRRRLLPQPDGLRRAPRRRPSRLAALAGRACCSSAARASGRTRPARWTARARSPRCWSARESVMSSTSGGTTWPTTGRHGARNSPTICRASADARHHPPHRPAPRHRGRLAHRLRDHRLAPGVDQGRGRLDATASTSSA